MDKGLEYQKFMRKVMTIKSKLDMQQWVDFLLVKDTGRDSVSSLSNQVKLAVAAVLTHIKISVLATDGLYCFFGIISLV